MKLDAAGQSYSNRALAAAAQQSLNFFRETIEDPEGSGKSAKILKSAPGYHLLVDLSISGVIRGFFSGGGRLFVCVGTTIYELDSTGATISSHILAGSPGSTGTPVQMFGNGNQLGIVADGFFYIDNGIPPPFISYGPLQARFQIKGVVTAVGTAITWVSGDKFPPEIVGIYIIISGKPKYVTARADTTHLTIADGLGGGTGIVTTFFDEVFLISGDLFSEAMVGLPIIINGVSYVVLSVNSPWRIILTTFDPGQQYNVAYSSVQANLVYSAAAGPLVTAVTGAYLDGSFYVQRPAVSPIAYTDLVITAINTTVTSAAHPFNETQTNEILIVSGGTGFTAGTYFVVSVDVFHVATLSAAVGTVGSTGGTATGYPEDLGRQVNFSAVNDGTSWSGLDFFTKEAAADYIQSILADREQLFVFGTQGSSEVWQNDPNTGRPVRIQGAVAAEGEAARYCTVSMQERIYFLGQSPGGGTVAYRVDGFTPTRISTHAVEEAWKAKTSTIATNVVGWWYEEDGHFFWVICFDNGTSWVYDATEKFWHERARWTGSAFAAYRFWYHTFIPEWGTNGRHIVGDHFTGKIFMMDATFGDEEGVNMKRVRAMPYLFSAGRRIFCGRVQLAQAAGSTLQLDWSSDDGATFTTPENGSGTGPQVYWLAQGSFENSAIPRISVTGQVVATIIDVDAEITYGTT